LLGLVLLHRQEDNARNAVEQRQHGVELPSHELLVPAVVVADEDHDDLTDVVAAVAQDRDGGVGEPTVDGVEGDLPPKWLQHVASGVAGAQRAHHRVAQQEEAVVGDAGLDGAISRELIYGDTRAGRRERRE